MSREKDQREIDGAIFLGDARRSSPRAAGRRPFSLIEKRSKRAILPGPESAYIGPAILEPLIVRVSCA
jgi:hypothetical protein